MFNQWQRPQMPGAGSLQAVKMPIRTVTPRPSPPMQKPGMVTPRPSPMPVRNMLRPSRF